MIKPINKHILIEPVKHESFMFSERQTYDEVGIVVDIPDVHGSETSSYGSLKRGDKVFFDSWLAAKFPKDVSQSVEEYYWLVPYDSIKAYEPLPA